VLYPVLIACMLVAGFVVHESLACCAQPLRPTGGEWGVASAGACAVVVSFCWNWRVVTDGSVPGSFPVELFVVGALLGVVPFAVATRRALREARR
jgi:hypothetical protein